MASAELIRFGITGSGFMGKTHAEAIRRLPNARLVAVAGGTRAAPLAASYGIALEPDHAALAQRSDIDAIIVTTPHHLHAQDALAALENGKHVMVEKPMATSLDDCDRMVAAAERKGLTIGIGYHQRFRTNNARAVELMRANAIGRLQSIQVSMPMYAGSIRSGGFGGNWAWWNDPRSLGHLLNAAPHTIDLLRLFAGCEISGITALCRTFLPDISVEDTTHALFEFSSGAIGTLFASRALPAPSFPGEDFRFRLVGSTGLMDLDPYTELRIADESGWRVESRQPSVGHESKSTAFGDVRMEAYTLQISAFMDRIHGRPSRIGTAADGRAALSACLAMLKASAERRWISPD